MEKSNDRAKSSFRVSVFRYERKEGRNVETEVVQIPGTRYTRRDGEKNTHKRTILRRARRMTRRFWPTS